MNFDEVMAMLQSVEAPFIGDMAPEFALFSLAVAFFAFSTALCAMAVKASAGARDAREDARLMMRTVQDYAVEVRQLTAKAEKLEFAAREAQQGLTERIQGVRVGARNDTDEASLTTVEETETHPPAEEAANDVDAELVDEDANARLADATRAASEPRSLLSGMLRRR